MTEIPSIPTLISLADDLEGKLIQLYNWIYETEEKRLALEYQLITQDSEMNDLTVAMNEASGKL